jgi:hypothetical protein|tara:strand:+ start:745 stop:942 length:198 start_codon:yes stop_codon:yes gene_type:complete
MLMREPKLKDIIGGMSATDYLNFQSNERIRKTTLHRRRVARLMKERGFSVFMVGQTQRERKTESA